MKEIEETKEDTSKMSLNNQQLADVFDEIASLLEAQGANLFRVNAYRTGAQTIRRLPTPAKQILEEKGIDGLMHLPGIGNSLAHAMEHLIHTSRLPLLDRLRGDDMAERLFTSVPEIGPKFAKRLHEELGIETLNELELAAKDGRLGQVHGMGPKRVQAVLESLAGRRFLGKRQLHNDFSAPRNSREQVEGESRAQIPVA